MDEIELHKQLMSQIYSQWAREPERVRHLRSYVHRDREDIHLCLMQDYFNDNPTYGPTVFRHRFRMQKELKLFKKCTAAIRLLATGVNADTFDEYLKVADTTRRLCLKRFCKAVIQAYRDNSNNDINVLNQSLLFSDVLDGTAAPVIFEANRRYYQMGYYLCDDIYTEWRCFVKSPPMAINPKEARFKKMQELARKDVERAFGVLQARWGIIRSPSRNWWKHGEDGGFRGWIYLEVLAEYSNKSPLLFAFAAARWRRSVKCWEQKCETKVGVV
ncbi:uncharacterized protein LOC131009618 [Salvia miltiorrhiza]|uniref:uncharacterized protein LOC131009618 n=1 Tax=Salvia miltiorrhiza TaxID=226208 RepID=UPI0025ABE37F|nr:uncharacterized protein LOC131009618 [Salvia miltiorrhiza]